jgi:tRNA(fMet)-specific endonuclease VapC
VSSILLDTNAYIRYLGGDQRVLDELGRADTVFMSVFVLGELFAGFTGGSRARQNRATLDTFVGRLSVQILDATRETAEVFATLRESIKKAGTPLPTNDVWIAAHVFETGSVLVTFDEHFDRIPNLRVLRLDSSP